MRTQPAPFPPPAAGDRRRSPLPGMALAVALMAVAGGVVLLVDPAIVRGGLGSTRSLLLAGAGGAVLLAWAALLWRTRLAAALKAALVAAPVLAGLGLTLATALGPDRVVDEAFPVVAAPAAGTADAAGGVEGAAAEPDAGAAQPAAGAAGAAAPADGAAPAGAAAPSPAEPVERSRGSFVGLDGHTAVGDAALYELADGSLLVRLEDVDLHRVPEPYVYLVPGADAEEPGDGAIDLGPLSGNVGSSNYPVPADVDLGDGPWTVLVWCRPFASPVGGATQIPST